VGGQDVQEESLEESFRGQGAALDRGGAVVTIAECDLSVLEALDAAIGDGDAEDISCEIVQHLLAGAGMLEVDDPLLGGAPNGPGHGAEQACLVERVMHLGAKDG